MMECGRQIVPCPRVSFEKPTFASAGWVQASTESAARGEPVWRLDASTAAAPAWLAIAAGVGPSRVLVSWSAASVDAGAPLPCLPKAFHIESSADSSNGADGRWRLELRVTANTARARAHVIDFDGQSWVRLTVTGTDVPVALDALEIHDASDGTDDCWLFLGDELAARAFQRGADASPRFSEIVNQRYPGYFPAVINEARAGEAPQATLSRLAAVLAAHPCARYVAFSYAGVAVDGNDPHELTRPLESLVLAVLEAERVPVLARLPYASGAPRERVDACNRVIADLEQRFELVPGPDLCAWFEAHPAELPNGAPPTGAALGSVRRLWADAMDGLYVPQ